MNTVTPVKQRGVTFGGFVFGAFILVLASIFGLKLIPPYIEDAQVKSVFNAISHDPEMQNASLLDIRGSFDRRASIEGLKSVKSEDIEISTSDGRPFLSASYSVTVPLVGNASLVLEFNPTSAE